MEIWHLTFSTDGRFPLFQDEASCRAAIRKLVAIAGAEIVLYSIVDDHVHLVIVCMPGRKGKICSALLRSLRLIAATKVLPAYQRPVETRSHMMWLVRYLLQQVVHHGVDAHPATWSGSCFQDLIGARWLEGFGLRARKVLPRLAMKSINEMVGLPPRRIMPAGDADVRLAGVAGLVEAAGSALAVGPELRGRTAPVVMAKKAVAHTALNVGLSTREVARALKLTPRAVGFLRHASVGAELLAAVRVRISLLQVVSNQGKNNSALRSAAS